MPPARQTEAIMIRLINAAILTMKTDENGELLPILWDGELHVEGSRILYCGPAMKDTGDRTFDKTIDCGGNLLMPGFKNAHTHSAMTFLRSAADDLPLQEWLNNYCFPNEAKLTDRDIYTLTKLAILEYISGGTTAAMEMYLTPETIAQASDEMGFRMVQVGGCNNFSQSVKKLEEWYQSLNGKSVLTGFELGFHAEYTCSRELIGEISELAHTLQAPVYAHVSETAGEVLGCRERYGKSPVAFLADEGIFDYGGAGYHLVHTDEEDVRILKEKGIAVVSNPSSNAKLASGIAPLSAYLKAGVTVALGTDGPASNNALDMFREMYLATVLGKLREKDASAVPAPEVLKMATLGGSKVLRLPDTDVLAEGKLADVILVDLHQPNMQPVQNIPTGLVYNGSKGNVLMTMIHGKILFDRFDGRACYHLPEDPEKIYADCTVIRDRILGKAY